MQVAILFKKNILVYLHQRTSIINQSTNLKCHTYQDSASREVREGKKNPSYIVTLFIERKETGTFKRIAYVKNASKTD